MMKGRRKREKPVKENRPFCKGNTDPTYREYDKLGTYVTERGKIVGRSRNGLCAKHQRKVSVAIKHARHLALLPFIVGVH